MRTTPGLNRQKDIENVNDSQQNNENGAKIQQFIANMKLNQVGQQFNEDQNVTDMNERENVTDRNIEPRDEPATNIVHLSLQIEQRVAKFPQ